MEEILASIRRILREDEGTRAPAEEDDVLVLKDSMVADDDVLVLKDSMVADEDVLVLKDSMVADEDMLVLDSSMMAPADISTGTELPAETGLIAAHDESPVVEAHEPVHFASEPTIDTHMFDQPPPAEPEPEPAPVVVHEEFKLSPEDLVAPAPVPEPPPPPVPEPKAVPEDTFDEIFAKAAFVPPPPARQKEPVMESQIQSPEFLISEEASSAVANSIGSLMRSISTDRAVSVRPGGLTIEDIVREEIRPVLKAWFDTHLPSLVERIVRAEVGRVIDRTQL